MKNWCQKAEQIMAKRFGKDTVIALATVEGGIPFVRYINAYYEDGAFYAVTHARSNKMRQIRDNPAVAIAGEWFTGHGTGRILGYFGSEENSTIAQKLKKAFAVWIDNGHRDLGDQNTIILCITLTDALLLSHGTRYEF